MKLSTLIFLLLAAPALAQTDSSIIRFESGTITWEYEFPAPDSSDLDSMWALGTVGDNGEVVWRYVTGDHCNASRGHYFAGGHGVHIQTAEYNPSRDGVIQFTTAELTPGMGDVRINCTPAVLAIGETRVIDPGAMYTGRTHVYYRGMRMELFGEVAQSFDLRIGDNITDETLFWRVLSANNNYSIQQIRKALDTIPPQPVPTIEVQPITPTRTIKSDYSGEEYRAGTGYFSDPTGTLGDTTYLIDYKNERPSIYQLSRIDNKEAQPPPKYLYVFKKQKTAQVVSEIAGYGFIALGAYLGGKAEYYSRHHGTTEDWDTYHVTRDAGLVSTGFGAMLVGGSFILDNKLELWEIGVKGFGMLLGYRSIAEATYNGMKK